MKLPRLTANEIIKLIEKKGFRLVRQSGSHRIYKNLNGKRITIPYHSGKTLHPKITKQVFIDAEITQNELHGIL